MCQQFPQLPQCQNTPIPTPTGLPPGTIAARAVTVAASAATCAEVTGSVAYLPVTVGFIPATTPDTQVTGDSYVSWTADTGDYIVNDIPPAGYYQKFVCMHTDTNPTPVNSDTGTVSSAGTLTWDLGYTLGTHWTQVSGGDVTVASNLISYIPDTKLFMLDGTSGSPGVVTYGGITNFTGSFYNTSVSSTNWLVNDSMKSVDYYQLLFRRFGGAPAAYDYDTPVGPISKPAYKANMNIPYYVKGDMTTVGAWSVGTGKKLIIIVDGNLTIGGTINTVGTGFLAFIVNGDITVDSSVGTTYDSTSPVVEGVYITALSGTFATGDSTVAGRERFVGRGTFVAGNFALTRDLDSVGQNNNVAASLFIYNPANLVTMPDAMRASPISWQEVAP